MCMTYIACASAFFAFRQEGKKKKVSLFLPTTIDFFQPMLIFFNPGRFFPTYVDVFLTM